jgi:hypothetical protein
MKRKFEVERDKSLLPTLASNAEVPPIKSPNRNAATNPSECTRQCGMGAVLRNFNGRWRVLCSSKGRQIDILLQRPGTIANLGTDESSGDS